MNMIEVKQLTKRYGDKVAVKDLSFTAAKGEILGFLGPNGAGKTSTMRVITGFIPPTSGTVKVDGLDVVENVLETRRRIGYLPEYSPLYPEMTVADFLDFMAEMKEIEPGKKQKEIDRVVEQLELGPVFNRLTGNCSLGYRHRIGLAHALLGDPEILILDEPTSGLDPRQRIEIRDLIRGLSGRRTVILSSHVLPEVQQTCERVVIINNGELVAVDTPTGLATRMKGVATLSVTVRGSANKAQKAIKQIPGVLEIDIEADKREKNINRLTVSASPDKDLRELIFRALASSDVAVLELSAQDASLEDVFLQLTTEDPQRKEVVQ